MAYKHLGRRDEALNDFLELIRIQPKLDLGYYDAGVIYNLTHRYQEAVDAMTRAIDLRQDDRGLGRRRGERGMLIFIWVNSNERKTTSSPQCDSVRTTPTC